MILSGLQRVRPGMKVSVKNVAMTAQDIPAMAAVAAPAVSPGVAALIPTNTGGTSAASSNPIRTANPQVGRQTDPLGVGWDQIVRAGAGPPFCALYPIMVGLPLLAKSGPTLQP